MYNEIKFIKFFHILFLTIFHILCWGITDENNHILNSESTLYKLVLDIAPVKLFAGTLPVSAGVMLYYRVKDKIFNLRLIEIPFKEVLGMSLFLVFISEASLIMLFFSNPDGHFLFWGVLKFMALAIPLTYMLARINILILPILGILLILIAPDLRSLLLPYSNIAIDIIIGNIERDFYWPLSPWLSSVFLGFYFGHYYFNNNKKVVFKKAALVLGILLVMAAVFKIETQAQTTLNMSGIYNDIYYLPASTFILYYIFYFSLYLLSYFLSLHIPLNGYNIVSVFSQTLLYSFTLLMFEEHMIRKALEYFGDSILGFIFVTAVVLFINWRVCLFIAKSFIDKKFVITLKKVR